MDFFLTPPCMYRTANTYTEPEASSLRSMDPITIVPSLKTAAKITSGDEVQQWMEDMKVSLLSGGMITWKDPSSLQQAAIWRWRSTPMPSYY